MNDLSKSDIEFMLDYAENNLNHDETYHDDFMEMLRELIKGYHVPSSDE